jgi:lipopolysaccharide transport system ATP-binding protein
MSESVIQAENLSKKFCRNLKRSLWYGAKDLTSELIGREGGRNGQLRKHEFWALKDVNFELKRGECLGLIGRNGAGKTTLLRMLNGLIKPNIGKISIRGRVGALIALGAGFNPILTGRENIYVNGAVVGLSKREIDEKIDHIIDFAEIDEFIDAPVQSYSTGMQIRLGFAIASSLQPDILLLDEVLAVGDIAFQAKCFNTLSNYRDRGTAFILVSHSMHNINRYADRVLYLKNGKICMIGKPEEVIEKYTDDMNNEMVAKSNDGYDFSKIYGSGKLIIQSVIFLDTDGKQIDEIHSGQPLNLRIAFECKEDEINDPHVDIVIRDREGDFFQGTNFSYGQSLGILPKKGVIDINFQSIPANNERLRFYITILNDQTREVYDWKRHIPLKVKGLPGSHGRVKLQCNWTVSTNSV